MEAIIITLLVILVCTQVILWKTVEESHKMIFKSILEQSDLHSKQIESQQKIWTETLSMFAEALKKVK
jgi:hypothetical protein